MLHHAVRRARRREGGYHLANQTRAILFFKFNFKIPATKGLGDAMSRTGGQNSLSLALEVGDARDSVLEVLHHLRKKEAERAETHLFVTSSTTGHKPQGGESRAREKKRHQTSKERVI